MRYSPVELRHVKVARRLGGGYRRGDVDELLDDVAASYEEVWAERGELADRLEDAEKALENVHQRETLLANTLVAAEKAAAEAVESAKRQAEVIIAEAHQEARSITRAGQSERDRLFVEVRRVETLLRAALGIVEEAGEDGSEGPDPSWPNREDTREFEAVPPPTPLPEEESPEPLPPAAAGAEQDVAWG